MNRNNTKLKISIFVNYLCLIVIIFIQNLKINNKLILNKLIIFIIAVILLLITFYYVFWKTRLWHFTHKSLKKLDEREIQVSYQSLKYSYSIFTIAILIAVFIYAIFEKRFDFLFFISFLYLAHTLPGAVVIWRKIDI